MGKALHLSSFLVISSMIKTDDESERYCTLEEFEFDYYMEEWCKKNGFTSYHMKVTDMDFIMISAWRERRDVPDRRKTKDGPFVFVPMFPH